MACGSETEFIHRMHDAMRLHSVLIEFRTAQLHTEDFVHTNVGSRERSGSDQSHKCCGRCKIRQKFVYLFPPVLKRTTVSSADKSRLSIN